MTYREFGTVYAYALTTQPICKCFAEWKCLALKCIHVHTMMQQSEQLHNCSLPNPTACTPQTCMPSIRFLLAITNLPAECSCFFCVHQEYTPNLLPENRSSKKGNFTHLKSVLLRIYSYFCSVISQNQAIKLPS